MKKKLIVLSGFVLSLAPVVALAVDTTGTTCANTVGAISGVSNVFQMLCRFSQIFNSIIPALIALAVVYFVFGVVTYVIADEEEAKKKGRMRMIYGIVGLAVIVSMWGLVSILTNTFGFTNTAIEGPSVGI